MSLGTSFLYFAGMCFSNRSAGRPGDRLRHRTRSCIFTSSFSLELRSAAHKDHIGGRMARRAASDLVKEPSDEQSFGK